MDDGSNQAGLNSLTLSWAHLWECDPLVTRQGYSNPLTVACRSILRQISILFFSVLLAFKLCRLSALAFGKFFERGCRIFFTCIWSAANRAFGVFPKVPSDD